MKKRTALTAALAALLLLLTACADDVAVSGTHTHAPAGSWQVNGSAHWHLCECGEKTDAADHTVTDFICTVCGAEIFSMDDGTSQVSLCDDAGRSLLFAVYTDADGAELYSYRYTYSEDGSKMYEKSYEAGKLVSEQDYLLDKDFSQTTLRSVRYNEDGSYSLTEYDERGSETLEAEYGADGKAVYETRYENDYDADGNRTLRRTYEGSRLVNETEFLFGSDEEGSWSMSAKQTDYHEDGSRTVSDADWENNTWSMNVTYAADGTVLEHIRYEYVKDENGEDLCSKGYRNGRLFEEAGRRVNEAGEAIGTYFTDYSEDGTKAVREYDLNFDLVKSTIYGADGTVISES